MDLPNFIPKTGSIGYTKVSYNVFNNLRDIWFEFGLKEINSSMLGRKFLFFRVARHQVTNELMFLVLYVNVIIISDYIVFEHGNGHLKSLESTGFGSNWFLL